MNKSALLAASLLWIGSASAADLVAYTEEWPPYNYLDQGKVRGISTDLLRAMCSEAALDCRFELVPWARAYAMALNRPNTLVYTTARKPEREQSFTWIGPILPRATWVFGLRESDLGIKHYEDLNHYRIGVVRSEASISDLLGKDVQADAMLQDSSDAAITLLLLRGVVQAVVNTEVGMAWELYKAGASPDRAVKLLPLSDQGAYYYALNLKSDPAIATKLQDALEKLRKSGQLARIVAQYTSPKP
ncbi:transporter substrate-binding domain-containing protein [Chitinivorax sp. PXF-14]|uniref:substrate-binding periplasmic protein n=1 Tax=Chitinivorax sp. PXF-14 TaxID=3230488 RepID=UPI00346791D5